MKYSIKDIIMPFRWNLKNKNVNFIDEFQKWANKSLSLENILENILEIEKLKKDNFNFTENFANKNKSKTRTLYNPNKILDKFKENYESNN